MEMFLNHNCLKCGYPLYDSVNDYAVSRYGFPLCKVCQNWLTEKSKATEYAKRLYLALKQRNVPAELEKYDGHKTIDIAITCLKINIEVDGSQHNMDSRQALSDLNRTKFSLDKGFFTLRVPNSVVKDNIEKTADIIVDILQKRKEEIEKSKHANETDISPKELQLHELVTDFLSWFYIVFEQDWAYGKECIKYQDCDGLLSTNHENWGNKEYMLMSFYKLIEYMTENKIFNSTMPNCSDSDADNEVCFNIIRCYFGEFIDNLPQNLFKS